MSERRVVLTTGATIELDGNVDKLVETIYDEVVVKGSYQGGFSDVASELSLVISQMSAEDKERYLFISLGVMMERFHREMYRGLDGDGPSPKV